MVYFFLKSSSLLLPVFISIANVGHSAVGAVPIQNIAVGPDQLLDVCQGDCDVDDDCAGLLRCFHRQDEGESAALQHVLPRGCEEDGDVLVGIWDYCYDPTEYRGPDEHQVCGNELEYLGIDNVPLLGCCQGDCDNDSDCAGQLICHQRNLGVDTTAPHGCNGDPLTDYEDYCYDPNYSAPPQANGGGDPHFRTFSGHFFSFHGGCDLVLMRSKNFDAGSGLSVYIRTTRVDTPRGISFSYISGTAIQIGKAVFEVSDNGNVLIDGKKANFISDESGTTNSSFAGYNLENSIKGTNGRIVVFDIDLHDNRRIKIRSNTKSGMIFVDIDGYFEDSDGLLGAAKEDDDGKLYSRDGSIEMMGNWNAYAEDWQVRDTEPTLFQESRAPQYPVGCVYEDQSPLVGKNKKKLRRRHLLALGENEGTGVTREEAMEACSHAVGEMKVFCIDDVVATGDVELSTDPFYNL